MANLVKLTVNDASVITVNEGVTEHDIEEWMHAAFLHVGSMAENAWNTETAYSNLGSEVGTEVALAEHLGDCSADAYEAICGLKEMQMYIGEIATGEPSSGVDSRWEENYEAKHTRKWEGSPAAEAKAFEMLGASGRQTMNTLGKASERRWLISDLGAQATHNLVAKLLRRSLECYKYVSEICANLDSGHTLQAD